MTFPDLRTEIKVGTWTDVTGYVYTRDGAIIHRGRPDEASSAQAQTYQATLDNRTGRFSPLVPTGPYYGLLGRNTPVRVSAPGDGSKFCRLPGGYGVDNITTPDAAALHITGSIDIRVDASLANWDQYQTLVQRWRHSGTASSWIFYLGGSGNLRFAWTTDGNDTGVNWFLANSATNLNLAPGVRQAIRVTLDTTTGTVTFYQAATIAGSWTALGTNYQFGGPSATSIFAGTEPLIIGESGQARTLNQSICAGQINQVQVLSGIGGSAVANPDFTSLALGATSFTDAAGRAWTLNGDCEVTDRQYRGHFEISTLDPRWDVAGKDVFTQMLASGVLRRLGQGSSAVTSPLKRAISVWSTSPDAYWSGEDASGSTSIASSSNAHNMTVTGSPSYASDTHIGGSAALPAISSSTWTGAVPSYTLSSPNTVQVAFVCYLPTAPPTGAILIRLITPSTRFDFGYSTSAGGGFYINAYDAATGSLVSVADNSTSPFAAALTTPIAVSIELAQSGSAISYSFHYYTVSSTYGVSYANLTSRTLSRVTTVVVDPTANLTDTVLGHITVYAPIATAASTPTPYSALTGNAGETAGNRFVRLCLESGIQPRTYGDPFDSPGMGGQGVDTLLNLLQQCIAVDGGLLYEPRDVLGLGMRMQSSLFNQASSVTLSHSGQHLSGSLEPTQDDQLVRNDVTLTNSGTGNAVRATLDQGPMSTQQPPNGVGRYQDQGSLNLSSDDLLDDLASWAVHTHTVNEQRWPGVQVQMEGPVIAANQALALAVQALDIGSQFTLTGMPAWQPPDDSRQIVQGYTETYNNKSWIIIFNGSPASPYDVLLLDDGTYARLDLDGSALHAAVTSGATTFQVDTDTSTSLGCLWSATDTPYDVLIGGERMTVTAVTSPAADGTFESGVSGWTVTGGSLAQSAAQAHSGTNSALLTVSGSPTQAFFRNTFQPPVVPGTNYTATMWVYSPGGSSNFSASINWRDSGGALLSTSGQTFTVPAATWTPIYVSGVAPASAAAAQYGPTLTGSPANGTTFYTDDIAWSPFEAQTFTVTRSVNGVVKAHSAAEAIHLFQPVYLAPY